METTKHIKQNKPINSMENNVKPIIKTVSNQTIKFVEGVEIHIDKFTAKQLFFILDKEVMEVNKEIRDSKSFINIIDLKYQILSALVGDLNE